MGENKARNGTGIEPTAFKDSLVINLVHKNVKIEQIKDAFGYSSRIVVTDKIHSNIFELSDAINQVYPRIKVSGH
jgi:hypothetical protein